MNSTTITPTTALPTTETLPWYKRLWHAIIGGVTKIAQTLYEIVAPTVHSAALQFVNDPRNQAAAMAAVQAAIDRGLKGDKAWSLARNALLDQLGESAWEIAENWLDTLLQSAYFAVKNTITGS